MLSEANIPHTTETMFDGWQVCYPDNKKSEDCVMDAIQHYGSYGSDVNKLEIMGLLTPDEEEHDSVVGWLTAEDVFERICEHYNGTHSSEETTPDNPTIESPSTEAPTTPLTPEEFTKQMQEAFDVYYLEKDDEEEVHIVMDGIMCNLLRQLGYGDGVDIFNKTPMWYA